MQKTKYIRTCNNEIIVFSELQNHSEFLRYKPISAGFISFGVDEERNTDCFCYGESVSLKLKSNESDTGYARKQILGINY